MLRCFICTLFGLIAFLFCYPGLAGSEVVYHEKYGCIRKDGVDAQGNPFGPKTSPRNDCDEGEEDFSCCNLEGWNLKKINVLTKNKKGGTVKKKFNGANLKGAVFPKITKLSPEDFEEHDFTGVEMRGANLQSVKFKDVNLAGVDARGTDVRGADFTEAFGLIADFQLIPEECNSPKPGAFAGEVTSLLGFVFGLGVIPFSSDSEGDGGSGLPRFKLGKGLPGINLQGAVNTDQAKGLEPYFTALNQKQEPCPLDSKESPASVEENRVTAEESRDTKKVELARSSKNAPSANANSGKDTSLAIPAVRVQ